MTYTDWLNVYFQDDMAHIPDTEGWYIEYVNDGTEAALYDEVGDMLVRHKADVPIATLRAFFHGFATAYVCFA